jgi:hypothetical protein
MAGLRVGVDVNPTGLGVNPTELVALGEVSVVDREPEAIPATLFAGVDVAPPLPAQLIVTIEARHRNTPTIGGTRLCATRCSSSVQVTRPCPS